MREKTIVYLADILLEELDEENLDPTGQGSNTTVRQRNGSEPVRRCGRDRGLAALANRPMPSLEKNRK